MRRNARFFLLAALAGVGLRLCFVVFFPAVVDDSRFYADIAKNWLQHGIYGVTDSGQIVPTLSRLPGYPGFLATIFAIFGIDNFRVVLLVQVLFDLATCFLVADLARRLFSAQAAKAAFLLVAICPFLANYAAAALTETLEIFFTVLVLDLAMCGLRLDVRGSAIVAIAQKPPAVVWFGCGLAVGAGILLRPDGGILLAAVAGSLLLLTFRALRLKPENPLATLRPMLRAGALLAAGVTVMLAPWTLRNLITLHRFEPLAPRYANDSDELVMTGFNRWVKTWMADYVSVQEIYWNVPGAAIEVARLPVRAFDSAQQREETTALFAAYNSDHEMTPEVDARFAALAASRIHSAPFRYYVWLPGMRVVDMWFRPRTELLASDPRWWEFNDDRRWLAVSIVFGFVNFVYLGMAAAGLTRARAIFGAGLFVLFLLLRSVFLGTLENPEPRYTLECYPVAILFASALFSRPDKLPNPGRYL